MVERWSLLIPGEHARLIYGPGANDWLARVDFQPLKYQRMNDHIGRPYSLSILGMGGVGDFKTMAEAKAAAIPFLAHARAVRDMGFRTWMDFGQPLLG